MTATASGFFYPATSYTSGIYQAMKDAADASETVADARARTFRVANAAAKTALAGSYTLRTDDKAYQVDVGITYRYNGSAWKEWESGWLATYTPTTTGLTAGTGGWKNARYRYRGGMILDEFAFNWGTAGGAVGTAPTVTLAVASETVWAPYQLFGVGWVQDSGGATAGVRIGVIANIFSTTIVELVVFSGTYGTTGPLTATIPITFAASDGIHFRIERTPA